MSLDLLPENADLASTAAPRPWTGRYAVSAGLFEIRPRQLPCDVRPVLDDDLDCIIGYQRTFAYRSYRYDLNGNMLAVWEAMKDLSPPEKRDSVLVVGGHRCPDCADHGGAIAQAFRRSRTLAAAVHRGTHRRMDDPERFLPVHILRLAMRHGERAAPPPGWPGATRYLVRMLIRRLPFTLDVVTANTDTVVVQFDYWRYADTLPDARVGMLSSA